jgi:hypothetical protein
MRTPHHLIPKRLPSPAFVVAVTALVLAISGGAYAATRLAAKSVGTRQLRNGAVTSSKLRPGAVGTRQLANNAVTGAKVADGSLTGQDVNASTLGQVPRAADANNLGGEPAAHYQRLVRSACGAGQAISKVNADGSVQCTSPVAPLQAVLAVGRTATLLFGTGGAQALVDTQCHIAGQTSVRFFNAGDAAMTVNWFYSTGTVVGASGVSLAPGAHQDFVFTGARVEGQFIASSPAGETTVNLHAYDGGTFCEANGTAELAPNP